MLEASIHSDLNCLSADCVGPGSRATIVRIENSTFRSTAWSNRA